MPWENDEHKRAAQVLFTIPEASVTKEQRYVGKVTRHSSNYGASGKTLSETMLKDGFVHTPKECDAFIHRIIDVDTPEVRDWQQRTRMEVMRFKRLTNSWGRTIDFSYDRFGDDLYRRAYAWRPQGDVGDLLNQCGLIPLFAYLKQERLHHVAVNVQAHDALVLSSPPEPAYDVVSFLKDHLEVERDYDGVKLRIPVTVKVGRTWKGDVEFKKFPSRDEFEQVVYELAQEPA